MPVDFAAQRHPAFLDLYLDAVARHRDLPVDDVDDALGDLIVSGALRRRIADLDVFSDRGDTFDAGNGAFGGKFLCVARHVAREGCNAVVDGNTDVRGVDT